MNQNSKKSNACRMLLCILLGLSFCLIANQTAKSESSVGFEARGTIKYDGFWTDGSVYLEQENDFVVRVVDCNWYIKLTPKKSLKFGKERNNPLADYKVALTDGTNFFEVTAFKNAKTENGRIGSGTVPFGLSDPKFIVLWYALEPVLNFCRTERQA